MIIFCLPYCQTGLRSANTEYRPSLAHAVRVGVHHVEIDIDSGRAIGLVDHQQIGTRDAHGNGIRAGTLSDGRKVTVRPHSKSNGPTLDIQTPGGAPIRKYRYLGMPTS